MTTIAPRATGLRERLACVVAAVLRLPVSCIRPHDSFASLGMDSLAAVELTAAIEDELRVSLSLTVVHEHPSLDALCRFLERAPDDETDRRRRRRLADATLPADIVPRGAPALPARDILLTGATGFLGAHLLRTLLDETTAVVHCLVRPSAIDGVTRVQQNLVRYDLSLVGLDRVRIVDADITQPPIDIADQVDAIYHAAAEVNWIHSYDTLRDANVVGTRELLRLACIGTPKPFHFVSSTSVCHSTTGPRVVDERTDVFASVDGLRLGYAETKCVAEALVFEAGRRGLPVTVLRPSLITGDSSRGRTNADDLTSRFIAGCIRLHAAPDLDWRMDCVPVDDAARSIVRLASAHDHGTRVAHITAAQPRHWRELVLWMRVAGYDIELLPYAEWADVLRATPDSTNPLHGLRSFFLQTIAEDNHLTLPQLFEESRRARVDGHATARDLPLLGAQTRALDTALIGRYFDDFVAQRVVPDTPRRPRTVATTLDVSSFVEPLSQLLNAPIQVEDIALTPFTTDGSIIAELTTHRAGATGLFDARVSVATAAGSRCDLRVFVKAKSEDACTIDVAEALGALASPTLGETVKRFRVDLGLTRSHLRELAVYALENDALRRHMPRALLIERDDARDRWLLGLEWIDDAILMNATDASQWSSDAIDAAVTGLAQIHSAFFGRVAGLAEQPWLAPRRDRAKRVEMTPLWAALASHAHDHSAAWSDARVRRIHQRLVGDVGSWAHALDGATHTLIHNDFNPRNIAIRAGSGALQLCAFDWELAAIGAPQRDLAELLCFVLPPNASLATIAHWIDRHRVELAKHTATEISRSDWETGFSAALCDFLVDRLAMYAMVDRVRPQRFVPRVVRSWLNIFRHYPWVG